MKILGILACLFTVNAAFAQPAQPSSSQQAMAWVKSQLNGQKSKDINGVTSSGKQCALFLTDISVAGIEEDYYVVVGYPNARDMNDYIGLGFSQGKNSRVGNFLEFISATSWGNDSYFNHVFVVTDAKGKPTLASGQSDLKTIDCHLQ